MFFRHPPAWARPGRRAENARRSGRFFKRRSLGCTLAPNGRRGAGSPAARGDERGFVTTCFCGIGRATDASSRGAAHRSRVFLTSPHVGRIVRDRRRTALRRQRSGERRAITRESDIRIRRDGEKPTKSARSGTVRTYGARANIRIRRGQRAIEATRHRGGRARLSGPNRVSFRTTIRISSGNGSRIRGFASRPRPRPAAKAKAIIVFDLGGTYLVRGIRPLATRGDKRCCVTTCFCPIFRKKPTEMHPPHTSLGASGPLPPVGIKGAASLHVFAGFFEKRPPG